jgi:2-aminoadipate transaminase
MPRPPRFATWLVEGPESATDRALSNPAALGYGADLIGFGGGQPAVETYPLEALERAYVKAIQDSGARTLPYGPTQGLPALRELISERLARRGIQAEPDNIVILTGSVQGLHIIGRITLDRGGTIVTEAPTFMGALAAWEQQQPRYLTIPIDEHGMQVELLKEALHDPGEPRPDFVYLLPTFQNPSGVSLSRARRERLLEIAREHDLLIIEDDPYGEFWFEGDREPIPPLRALPGAEAHVVYVGTFSKILAPGIRLAYAVVAPELMPPILRSKRGIDFHTDTLLQQAVVHLARDVGFDFDAHVRAGRRLYRARRDAMLDSLETTFGSTARWTRPDGGFFLWVDLPKDVSAEAAASAALGEGVAVFPGTLFFAKADGGTNGLRLSFSNTSPERIREGVERLKRGVAAAGG